MVPYQCGLLMAFYGAGTAIPQLWLAHAATVPDATATVANGKHHPATETLIEIAIFGLDQQTRGNGLFWIYVFAGEGVAQMMLPSGREANTKAADGLLAQAAPS